MRVISLSNVIVLFALAGCLGAEKQQTSVSHLSGLVIDAEGAPVADAEVYLLIGSVAVTERVRTDDLGAYELAVPDARVREASRIGAEVTMAIESPLEDLAPYGTAEGDRVHLLPASLDEFVDMQQLAPEAKVSVRDVRVPLQARGYEMTDELLENGGELSWTVPSSQFGDDLVVTLLIEPGSIQLTGRETQREITLTVLEYEDAPMQVPEGGYGPIWTIQPRDVVFDPPARVRIDGERLPTIGLNDMGLGDTAELYGASLEQGWQLFGKVELVGLDDNRITLESTEGIIRRGAWGHVFAGSDTDSGCLVTCRMNGVPTSCMVLDDNFEEIGDCVSRHEGLGAVACYQWDYASQHFDLYPTDLESACGACSNNGVPSSQLALGISLCAALDEETGLCAQKLPSRAVRIAAVALCPEERAITDVAAREAAVKARILATRDLDGDWSRLVKCASHYPDAPDCDADYGVAQSGQFDLFDRNFSYQANIDLPDPSADCAEYYGQ